MTAAAPTTATETDADLPPPAGDRGLLFGVRLDGEGGGRLVGWDDVRAWDGTGDPLWIHVDAGSEHIRSWLKEESGLTGITVTALLDPAARPRVFQGRTGYITILRGVNLNEGADPEDMVAMRLWSDGTRVISLRHSQLKTPRGILDDLLGEAAGPRSAPELYEQLVGRLVDYIGVAIDEYENRMEAIEDIVDDGDIDDLRAELSNLRQDIVSVRRYMSPQRSALERLMSYPPDWLPQNERLLMRESADQFDRYLEDLDQIRERTLVAKDDIQNRQNERMNRNMYVLSIVAAIFLPLGFLTGLFGINVGGMPGVDNVDAFWIVTIIMIIITGVELWFFRKMGWI
ncbi:MAG: zinc transporter ZntB [Pseudomonadota bacterium]